MAVGEIRQEGGGYRTATFAPTMAADSWADFEIIQLVLVPLFLCSATFFPLSTYTSPVQLVVQCTPPGLLWHAVYLAVMGLIGLAITARRLERLLLP